MIIAAIENLVPPAYLDRYSQAANLGRNVLRAVIEVPPDPAHAHNTVKLHARFAANLAEIIRDAGAEALLRR